MGKSAPRKKRSSLCVFSAAEVSSVITRHIDLDRKVFAIARDADEPGKLSQTRRSPALSGIMSGVIDTRFIGHLVRKRKGRKVTDK